MSDTGYIADQPWMHTYQDEIGPQYVRFASAFAGVALPPIKSYCELAYGQGISLAIHAACNQDVMWHGTDLNPGHAQSLSRLAAASGVNNLRAVNQSFADYFSRGELPNFDAVALMGTWSWIPEREQSRIIAFLGRKLVDGGVFSLHYATLPGQSAVMGLCHILRCFSGGPEDEGPPLVARIPGAVQRTLDFLDINPAYAGEQWGLRSLTESLQKTPPAHLAHEYFNYNWKPQYFAEIAGLLAEAGLQFAAQSAPSGAIESLAVAPRQAAFLRTIEERVKREQLRDYVLNTSGRSDHWVRGAARLVADRFELLAPMRVALIAPESEFKDKVHYGIGAVALAREAYGALLGALAAGARERDVPLSINELAENLGSILSRDDLIEALAILLDQRMIQIVNGADGEIARSRATARALNRQIMTDATSSADTRYLGSPLTGAGVKVTRMRQLFLLAREDGATSVEKWTAFAAAAMAGSSAETTDPVLIEREAEEFEKKYLPIYRTLLIAD